VDDPLAIFSKKAIKQNFSVSLRRLKGGCYLVEGRKGKWKQRKECDDIKGGPLGIVYMGLGRETLHGSSAIREKERAKEQAPNSR
jgi:hypothetical protein